MKLLSFLLICGFLSFSNAHSYKSGECPTLEPMQGFDMRKVSWGLIHLHVFFINLMILSGNILRHIRGIDCEDNSGNFLRLIWKKYWKLIRSDLSRTSILLFKCFCKAFNNHLIEKIKELEITIIFFVKFLVPWHLVCDSEDLDSFWMYYIQHVASRAGHVQNSTNFSRLPPWSRSS